MRIGFVHLCLHLTCHNYRCHIYLHWLFQALINLQLGGGCATLLWKPKPLFAKLISELWLRIFWLGERNKKTKNESGQILFIFLEIVQAIMCIFLYKLGFCIRLSMTNIPVLLMQLSSAERISIVFLFRGTNKTLFVSWDHQHPILNLSFSSLYMR